MKEQRYKVKMDIELMLIIKDFIDYSIRTYPFTHERLIKFSVELHKMIQTGCFKHSIIMKTIRTAYNETTTYCPKCNPEYHKGDEDD